MAHSKQAEKRIRQNEKARVRNKATSSRLKTLFKNVITAAEGGDGQTAAATFAAAASAADKAAKNGVIHKNTAARRKARMARMIQKAKSGS
jgi:small subunit ribosomal protein S20